MVARLDELEVASDADVEVTLAPAGLKEAADATAFDPEAAQTLQDRTALALTPKAVQRPKVTWQQVASSQKFATLDPDKQEAVLRKWTDEQASYLRSLRGYDPADLDARIAAFKQRALAPIEARREELRFKRSNTGQFAAATAKGFLRTIGGMIGGFGRIQQARDERDERAAESKPEAPIPADDVRPGGRLPVFETEEAARAAGKTDGDVVAIRQKGTNKLLPRRLGGSTPEGKIVAEPESDPSASLVSGAYTAAGEVLQAAADAIKTDEKKDRTFWLGDVPNAFGSAGAFVAGGAAAGPSIAVLGGTALQMDHAYRTVQQKAEEARERGQHDRAIELEGKTLEQMWFQAPVGAIEGLGVGGAPARWFKATPFGRQIQKGVGRFIFGGSREGMQESLQGAMEDVALRYGDVDPDANPLDIKARAREFAAGAVVGGPLEMVSRGVEKRDQRSIEAARKVMLDEAQAVVQGVHPGLEGLNGEETAAAKGRAQEVVEVMELTTPEQGQPAHRGVRPAFKTAKGVYISDDPTHAGAEAKAFDAEGESTGEFGYVTDADGTFLDRKQAYEYKTALKAAEAKASEYEAAGLPQSAEALREAAAVAPATERETEAGAGKPEARPAEPLVIDKDAREQFRGADGAVDAPAFVEHVVSQARTALASGWEVTLKVGQTEVPIVEVSNGMLKDAKGQSWGAAPIMFGGTEMRVTPRLSPAPSRSGAGVIRSYGSEVAAQELQSPSRTVTEASEAWQNATYEGVKQALIGKGIEPAAVKWTPEAAARLHATILNNHARFGQGREELLELSRDTIRTELLNNVEQNGNPLVARNAAGQAVPYAASLRMRSVTGNEAVKLQREVSGDTADLIRQNTPTPDGNRGQAGIPTHESKQRLVDEFRTAIGEHFARFVKTNTAPAAAPDATPDQILRAAKVVMDEIGKDKTGRTAGLAESQSGRPSNVVRKIVADPEFRRAVEEQIFGGLTQFVKSRTDASILEQPKQVAPSGLTGREEAELKTIAKMVDGGLALDVASALLPAELQQKVKAVAETDGYEEGSAEVLKRIARLKGGKEAEQQRMIANALLANGDTFQIQADPTLAVRGADGTFNPRGYSIAVNPFLPDERRRWTILHEQTHAILFGKTEAYVNGDDHFLTESDIAALDEIERLREHALQNAGMPQWAVEVLSTHRRGVSSDIFRLILDAEPSLQRFYPLINLHEFMAGVFTESDFRELLKQIPDPSAKREARTLWQRIKALLRQLIRGKAVSEDSTFARAFDRTFELVKSGVLEDQLLNRFGESFDFKRHTEAFEAFMDQMAKTYGYESAAAMSIEDAASYSEAESIFRTVSPQLYGVAPLASLSRPTEAAETARRDIEEKVYSSTGGKIATAAHWLRLRLQDKFADLEAIQDAAAKRRGLHNLPDSENTYQAQEIYHGVVGERLRQLAEDELPELIAAVKSSGLTVEELNSYLYARHAAERNTQIAKINSDMPDGGSGMTNARAEAVLNEFEVGGKTEALKKAAARVDPLIRRGLDERLAAGLIDEATYDRLASFYKHYVPLKGREGEIDEELDGSGSQPGFDVRGEEFKRALGRSSRADNILANVFGDAAEAVVRAEKNRVGQTLLEQVRQNPAPDVWEIAEPEMIQVLRGDEVRAMADPRWTQDPAILAVKQNGETHYIRIKHEGLRRAFKEAGLGTQNALVNGLRRITQYVALINTQLSPEFIVSNFVRDFQGAGIRLGDEQLQAMRKAILRDTINGNAVKGAWDAMAGKTGTKWADAFNEMSKHGGRMIFLGQKDAADFQRQIAKLTAEPTHPTLETTKAVFQHIGGFIERANSSVENGIRLSTYVHAREAGLSPQKAAHLARTITINFTRKGEWGSFMNALWVFSNASIQGTAQMALAASRSPAVRKTLAGVVVTGFALDFINRALGGEDDDGTPYYDKIPEFHKNSNLIVMLPDTKGKYLRVPLPYGYNVPYVLGRSTASALPIEYGGGGRPALEAAGDTAAAAMDAFNPLGGSTSLIRSLVPTVARPFYEIKTNEDFAGRKIVPEQSAFAKFPQPPSQQHFPNVSAPAREITDKLNRLTGGNEVKAGAVSVSPEYLDYWLEQLTGGVGTFAQRAINTTWKAASGEKLESNDIPFWRKFNGEVPRAATIQRYYDLREAAFAAEAQIRSLRQERASAVEIKQARQENAAVLDALPRIKATDKRLAALRKSVRELRASKLSEAEKTRRIEALQTDMLVEAKKTLRHYNDRKRGGGK
jgi:hypothetical protein